jgi:hypothetical protein
VPRSIRLGTFCSCFGSLGEAIIIGGNTEHRLLGRFVVHLIREGARFFCVGLQPPFGRPEMAGNLDTQGWIDATRNGRAYAFFLRDGILWVRRNGKYKRTQVSGVDTIAGARALAGSIAGRKEDWDWVDETRAKRAGMPSD